MLAPGDLIRQYTGSDALPDGLAMFSGTIPAIGELRPSQRFEFEFRGSGVRPLATARILDPDAAGHWLNQINKARRVLNAGPEEGQDEEKETKRTDYSDGTAKFPMKELRLSGLLPVEPRPCPVNVSAMAYTGMACVFLVRGLSHSSSLP